jgi:hypothetical protein
MMLGRTCPRLAEAGGWRMAGADERDGILK